eukprot:GFYU01000535.1.p2 GENE.GFYU01000535.1~~GFYU01000535.1.p2  ORF type:complete len:280 (+),score=101.50 GFYU01000535.1:59-898(+)
MPAKKDKKATGKSPATTGKSPKPTQAAAPSSPRAAPKKHVKGVRTSGTRQVELISGLGKYSRSAMYHKSGKWAVKNKKTTKKAAAAAKTVTKQIGGKDNGGSRTIVAKTKWYPTEDIPKPRSHNKKPTSAKLRSSIVPGTVLIVLAGAHRGRRVVFLKQLQSGLLLVTGPFKVNGVPIRRINQAYVIATSTRISIPSSGLSKFNDAYFKKPESAKNKKTEGEFFDGAKKKAEVSDARVADQKAVDKAILDAVKKTPELSAYLGARFTLTKNTPPHAIKF